MATTTIRAMGASTIYDDVLIWNENVVCLLIFVTVLLLSYILTLKPDGIPPGPRFTLPFVGDLPLLMGGDVLGVFRKLRHEHGDVFSLYFGKELTIVLNSYKVIHEAAVVNGKVFAGRPSSLSNDATGGKNGIILSDGSLWSNQRRFLNECLQHFGFGKASFETKIFREVNCFISFLKVQKGRPIDVQKYIHTSVANVVISIVCGKRYDYDDELFQQLVLDSEIAANHVLKVSVLLKCAPFLKYLPGDPFCMELMGKNLNKWMEYYRNMYEEHVKKLDENDPKDFFDMFKGNNPDFTVHQLMTIAKDMFGAGVDMVLFENPYVARYDT